MCSLMQCSEATLRLVLLLAFLTNTELGHTDVEKLTLGLPAPKRGAGTHPGSPAPVLRHSTSQSRQT